MLKKLQNLLFEEDEDDFEEEEEEEIVPVRPQRPKKEATAPRQSTAAPKPVKETVMAEVEKPKQTMQRLPKAHKSKVRMPGNRESQRVSSDSLNLMP